MFKVKRLSNGALLLTTDWQWLIRLAWGKRRVSSKCSPHVKAYPGELSATLTVWKEWIKKNWRRKTIYIVVENDGFDHGAAFAEEIKKRQEKEQKDAKKRETLARLDQLKAAREQARKEKNFVLADQIRDEMIAAGIVVKDGKLE